MAHHIERVALIEPGSAMQANRGDVLHPFIADAVTQCDSLENRLLADALLKQYATIKLGYLREVVWHDGERAFERLASMADLTARVCYNDDVALAALGFARQRGIDVPVRVSIVGFDKTFSASITTLTSYDFGCRRAVRALVNHLVGIRGVHTPPPVVPEGHVNVRASAALARERV